MRRYMYIFLNNFARTMGVILAIITVAPVVILILWLIR